MPVKIRLARKGRRKLAMYSIVAADSRAPRDGKFIEKLGSYNPNTSPSHIRLNTERALYWLSKGALPTDTARSILSKMGVLLKKHLQGGVAKKALTEEQAAQKFLDWKNSKTWNNCTFIEEEIQRSIEKKNQAAQEPSEEVNVAASAEEVATNAAPEAEASEPVETDSVKVPPQDDSSSEQTPEAE